MANGHTDDPDELVPRRRIPDDDPLKFNVPDITEQGGGKQILDEHLKSKAAERRAYIDRHGNKGELGLLADNPAIAERYRAAQGVQQARMADPLTPEKADIELFMPNKPSSAGATLIPRGSAEPPPPPARPSLGSMQAPTDVDEFGQIKPPPKSNADMLREELEELASLPDDQDPRNFGGLDDALDRIDAIKMSPLDSAASGDMSLPEPMSQEAYDYAQEAFSDMGMNLDAPDRVDPIFFNKQKIFLLESELDELTRAVNSPPFNRFTPEQQDNVHNKINLLRKAIDSEYHIKSTLEGGADLKNNDSVVRDLRIDLDAAKTNLARLLILPEADAPSEQIRALIREIDDLEEGLNIAEAAQRGQPPPDTSNIDRLPETGDEAVNNRLLIRDTIRDVEEGADELGEKISDLEFRKGELLDEMRVARDLDMPAEVEDITSHIQEDIDPEIEELKFQRNRRGVPLLDFTVDHSTLDMDEPLTQQEIDDIFGADFEVDDSVPRDIRLADLAPEPIDDVFGPDYNPDFDKQQPPPPAAELSEMTEELDYDFEVIDHESMRLQQGEIQNELRKINHIALGADGQLSQDRRFMILDMIEELEASLEDVEGDVALERNHRELLDYAYDLQDKYILPEDFDTRNNSKAQRDLAQMSESMGVPEQEIIDETNDAMRNMQLEATLENLRREGKIDIKQMNMGDLIDMERAGVDLEDMAGDVGESAIVPDPMQQIADAELEAIRSNRITDAIDKAGRYVKPVAKVGGHALGVAGSGLTQADFIEGMAALTPEERAQRELDNQAAIDAGINYYDDPEAYYKFLADRARERGEDPWEQGKEKMMRGLRRAVIDPALDFAEFSRRAFVPLPSDYEEPFIMRTLQDQNEVYVPPIPRQ